MLRSFPPILFPANMHRFLSIQRHFWREGRQVRILVYNDYVTNYLHGLLCCESNN